MKKKIIYSVASLTGATLVAGTGVSSYFLYKEASNSYSHLKTQYQFEETSASSIKASPKLQGLYPNEVTLSQLSEEVVSQIENKKTKFSAQDLEQKTKFSAQDLEQINANNIIYLKPDMDKGIINFAFHYFHSNYNYQIVGLKNTHLFEGKIDNFLKNFILPNYNPNDPLDTDILDSELHSLNSFDDHAISFVSTYTPPADNQNEGNLRLIFRDSQKASVQNVKVPFNLSVGQSKIEVYHDIILGSATNHNILLTEQMLSEFNDLPVGSQERIDWFWKLLRTLKISNEAADSLVNALGLTISDLQFDISTPLTPGQTHYLLNFNIHQNGLSRSLKLEAFIDSFTLSGSALSVKDQILNQGNQQVLTQAIDDFVQTFTLPSYDKTQPFETDIPQIYLDNKTVLSIPQHPECQPTITGYRKPTGDSTNGTLFLNFRNPNSVTPIDKEINVPFDLSVNQEVKNSLNNFSIGTASTPSITLKTSDLQHLSTLSLDDQELEPLTKLLHDNLSQEASFLPFEKYLLANLITINDIKFDPVFDPDSNHSIITFNARINSFYSQKITISCFTPLSFNAQNSSDFDKRVDAFLAQPFLMPTYDRTDPMGTNLQIADILALNRKTADEELGSEINFQVNTYIPPRDDATQGTLSLSFWDSKNNRREVSKDVTFDLSPNQQFLNTIKPIISTLPTLGWSIEDVKSFYTPSAPRSLKELRDIFEKLSTENIWLTNFTNNPDVTFEDFHAVDGTWSTTRKDFQFEYTAHLGNATFKGQIHLFSQLSEEATNQKIAGEVLLKLGRENWKLLPYNRNLPIESSSILNNLNDFKVLNADILSKFNLDDIQIDYQPPVGSQKIGNFIIHLTYDGHVKDVPLFAVFSISPDKEFLDNNAPSDIVFGDYMDVVIPSPPGAPPQPPVTKLIPTNLFDAKEVDKFAKIDQSGKTSMFSDWLSKLDLAIKSNLIISSEVVAKDNITSLVSNPDFELRNFTFDSSTAWNDSITKVILNFTIFYHSEFKECSSTIYLKNSLSKVLTDDFESLYRGFKFQGLPAYDQTKPSQFTPTIESLLDANLPEKTIIERDKLHVRFLYFPPAPDQDTGQISYTISDDNGHTLNRGSLVTFTKTPNQEILDEFNNHIFETGDSTTPSTLFEAIDFYNFNNASYDTDRLNTARDWLFINFKSDPVSMKIQSSNVQVSKVISAAPYDSTATYFEYAIQLSLGTATAQVNLKVYLDSQKSYDSQIKDAFNNAVEGYMNSDFGLPNYDHDDPIGVDENSFTKEKVFKLNTGSAITANPIAAKNPLFPDSTCEVVEYTPPNGNSETGALKISFHENASSNSRVITKIVHVPFSLSPFEQEIRDIPKTIDARTANTQTDITTILKLLLPTSQADITPINAPIKQLPFLPLGPNGEFVLNPSNDSLFSSLKDKNDLVLQIFHALAKDFPNLVSPIDDIHNNLITLNAVSLDPSTPWSNTSKHFVLDLNFTKHLPFEIKLTIDIPQDYQTIYKQKVEQIWTDFDANRTPLVYEHNKPLETSFSSEYSAYSQELIKLYPNTITVVGAIYEKPTPDSLIGTITFTFSDSLDSAATQFKKVINVDFAISPTQELNNNYQDILIDYSNVQNPPITSHDFSVFSTLQTDGEKSSAFLELLKKTTSINSNSFMEIMLLDHSSSTSTNSLNVIGLDAQTPWDPSSKRFTLNFDVQISGITLHRKLTIILKENENTWFDGEVANFVSSNSQNSNHFIWPIVDKNDPLNANIDQAAITSANQNNFDAGSISLKQYIKPSGSERIGHLVLVFTSKFGYKVEKTLDLEFTTSPNAEILQSIPNLNINSGEGLVDYDDISQFQSLTQQDSKDALFHAWILYKLGTGSPVDKYQDSNISISNAIWSAASSTFTDIKTFTFTFNIKSGSDIVRKQLIINFSKSIRELAPLELKNKVAEFKRNSIQLSYYDIFDPLNIGDNHKTGLIDVDFLKDLNTSLFSNFDDVNLTSEYTPPKAEQKRGTIKLIFTDKFGNKEFTTIFVDFIVSPNMERLNRLGSVVKFGDFNKPLTSPDVDVIAQFKDEKGDNLIRKTKEFVGTYFIDNPAIKSLQTLQNLAVTRVRFENMASDPEFGVNDNMITIVVSLQLGTARKDVKCEFYFRTSFVEKGKSSQDFITKVDEYLRTGFKLPSYNKKDPINEKINAFSISSINKPDFVSSAFSSSTSYIGPVNDERAGHVVLKFTGSGNTLTRIVDIPFDQSPNEQFISTFITKDFKEVKGDTPVLDFKSDKVRTTSFFNAVFQPGISRVAQVDLQSPVKVLPTLNSLPLSWLKPFINNKLEGISNLTKSHPEMMNDLSVRVLGVQGSWQSCTNIELSLEFSKGESKVLKTINVNNLWGTYDQCQNYLSKAGFKLIGHPVDNTDTVGLSIYYRDAAVNNPSWILLPTNNDIVSVGLEDFDRIANVATPRGALLPAGDWNWNFNGTKYLYIEMKKLVDPSNIAFVLNSKPGSYNSQISEDASLYNVSFGKIKPSIIQPVDNHQILDYPGFEDLYLNGDDNLDLDRSYLANSKAPNFILTSSSDHNTHLKWINKWFKKPSPTPLTPVHTTSSPGQLIYIPIYRDEADENLNVEAIYE